MRVGLKLCMEKKKLSVNDLMFVFPITLLAQYLKVKNNVASILWYQFFM